MENQFIYRTSEKVLTTLSGTDAQKCSDLTEVWIGLEVEI